MAADYRSVQTRMWREDDWFQTLDVDARLFWIYLFTNPSASPAGIYRLPIRTMAFECGVNADRIAELFAEFASVGKAYYEAGVVWIVNMRRLQFPTLIDGSREWQTAIRIAKDIDAIPDRCTLKAKYIKHSGYPIIVESMEGERVIRRVSIDYEYRIDTPSIPHSEGMDTPSIYVTKLNETKPNVTVTIEEHSTADAVPSEPKSDAPPRTLSAEFQEVQEELKTGKNKAATLQRWYVRCFGDGATPDYGYLGRVAKHVGGAGHLAQLMMQLAPRPPAGDVLAYILASHKEKPAGDTNGFAPSGTNGNGSGWAMPLFTGSEK